MASGEAIHEAGHLLACLIYGLPVEYAAITPGHHEHEGVVVQAEEWLDTVLAGDLHGYFWWDTVGNEETAAARKTIATALAGAAAQRLVFGQHDAGSASDYDNAYDLAQRIHAGHAEMGRLFVVYPECVVQEFLAGHVDELVAVADALDATGHLTRAEVVEVLESVRPTRALAKRDEARTNLARWPASTSHEHSLSSWPCLSAGSFGSDRNSRSTTTA